MNHDPMVVLSALLSFKLTVLPASLGNEWIQSYDAWTAHELTHNSLDDQTCHNPKNRYSAHIRHYEYSQVREK